MSTRVCKFRILTFLLGIFISITAGAVVPSDSGSSQPQSNLMDFSAKGTRIYRPVSSQATLTPPSRQSAESVIRNYLGSKNYKSDVVSSLVVSKKNADTKRGFTHIQMEQKLNSLTIYGVYVKASVNRNGELVQLIENIVTPSSDIQAAEIDARQAMDAVIAKHYPNVRSKRRSKIRSRRVKGNTTTFSKGRIFYTKPTATLVAIPYRGNKLEEGYLVQTWDKDNILRHTLVNRFGRVVYVELRTANDSYNIFPDNPGDTPQTIVAGPGAGNPQSPIGWVFTDTSTGNNVDAYLDTDDNDLPDIGGRPISVTQDFLTVADLTVSPSTTANKMVAVQNLFYLNNVIHDLLYQHGFNEAAGNFQEDNFSLGGLGSDSVNAEAQDGGSFNNANFATPPDGFNPRMQMYLWNLSTPFRDGDLESDIVFHEYGHGLTWRMIGSMSGQLSGAIGEGMGDVLAIIINNEDIMGAWSLNDPGGIRRFPYTGYPLTYGDVLGLSVHNDGEIYAATIWHLWQLWQGAGLSKDLLFEYLIQGMNFTAPGPAYEDMRDGILAAIPVLEHQCLVWDAFAKFGIGDGAQGVVVGGSVSITESFLVAPACFEDDTIPPDAVTDLAVDVPAAFSVSLSWTATGDDGMVGTASAYDLRYSMVPIDGTNFDTATKFLGVPAPSAPGTVETVTVTGLNPETQYYFAIKVIDNVLNASGISNVVSATTTPVTTIFYDDMESGDSNWTSTGTTDPGTGLPLWHLSTHRSNSPSTAFYYGNEVTLTYNTGAANNGQITSVPISLAGLNGSTLNFFHFLETENQAPYDAASVEVSNDGGTSWAQVFLTSIGTGGLMAEELIDLSSYDNQIIQLRFSFNTVDSVGNNFEGWVVDDVSILGSTPVRNLFPVISAVTATSKLILDTQTTQLEAIASDPDSSPSPLSYNWIVPPGQGSVDDPNSTTPIFTPADITDIQSVVITVEVSDGVDVDRRTVTVVVQDPASTVLLVEDFDDGDYVGWSVVDEGTERAPSRWSVQGGALSQGSGIFSNPVDASPEKLGSYLLYDGGSSWGNYRLRFSMTPGSNGAIGMMFRAQDSNNYYRFSWDQERSYRRLVKRVAGITSVLQEDAVPYVSGQTYQVEIMVQGSLIQVRIDGTLVFDVTDSSLSVGSIAPYVWFNSSVYFEDITVEGL